MVLYFTVFSCLSIIAGPSLLTTSGHVISFDQSESSLAIGYMISLLNAAIKVSDIARTSQG